LKDALPVALMVADLTITSVQFGTICMDSEAALMHAPLTFQLPTMSPPHGCTLPQLPLLLLPHVDRNGTAAIETRDKKSLPKLRPLVMRLSFAPLGAAGK
jgi:hypothetical protein